MSGFDWDDGRVSERAEDTNARADWDDHERAWAEARQDTLTRDAGERPGWPTHTERVKSAGYEADDPKGAVIP